MTGPAKQDHISGIPERLLKDHHAPVIDDPVMRERIVAIVRVTEDGFSA